MCAICVTNTCNVRTECIYVSVRASVYVCMLECFFIFISCLFGPWATCHVKICVFCAFCVSKYSYMCVCMCVCVHAGMCVCVYVCMYVCVYVYRYVTMFVCMHACMYVCVCVCMHVHMYVSLVYFYSFWGDLSFKIHTYICGISAMYVYYAQ